MKGGKTDKVGNAQISSLRCRQMPTASRHSEGKGDETRETTNYDQFKERGEEKSYRGKKTGRLVSWNKEREKVRFMCAQLISKKGYIRGDLY